LKTGKIDLALTALHKALGIMRDLCLIDENNSDYLSAVAAISMQIGFIIKVHKRDRESLEYLLTASRARERLSSLNPDNLDHKNSLAVILQMIGDENIALGESLAALELYQKALDLRLVIIQNFNHDPSWKRDAFTLRRKMGEVYLKLGNLNEAFANFSKALNILRALSEIDSHDIRHHEFCANTCQILGDIMATADPKKAIDEFYIQALDYRIAESELAPDDPDRRRKIALAHSYIAHAAAQSSQMELARAHAAESLGITEALVEKHPENVLYNLDLAAAYGNYSKACILEEKATYLRKCKSVIDEMRAKRMVHPQMAFIEEAVVKELHSI
jgi:tetratricopeptide (TPR) repeat protein